MSLHDQRQYNGYFPSRRHKYVAIAVFAIIGFWGYWSFARGVIFATMYVVAFGLFGILFVLLWE